jgi:hypothetical protein
MLAAALYGVTAISFLPGQTVDVSGTSSFSTLPAPNSPPATFALSRRGSLAVLLRPDSIGGNGAAEKLLIIRADGTRVTLGLPPAAVLTNAFRHYGTGSDGEPSFPNARFSGIALAGDGTPFATVSLPFSGAYSGVDDAVFRWNGARWRDVRETIALPLDTRNITIGAVDSARAFAANANYLDSFGNLDAVEHDPHTQENQALLVNGASTAKLGYGAATAMRDRFVAGYSNGDRLVVISGEPAHPSTALEWADGRRISLGPGIAYGVDQRGDVVGSNDPNLTGEGTPTLCGGPTGAAKSSASTTCSARLPGT